jgi:N-acetyl sugar amidotransferase
MSRGNADRECSRCLLSTRDTTSIEFDAGGQCSYCSGYDRMKAALGSPHERRAYFDAKIREIRDAGKNKKYDCILGLSGGADSSYMAHLAVENGLRPLIVHLDNGWNSDTAVSNIEKICRKLKLELFTHVIDWEEFAALQRAYLRAGVVDVEVLTDHAIYSMIRKLSVKFGLRYSLSGFNIETEAIMPKGWTYDKGDFSNIRDIVDKFGEGVKFRTFPYTTFWRSLYQHWVLRLESFRILNYVEYDRDKAKETLKTEFDWVDYGGKHYESVFTKFYQAYILPEKFGIDKRRAHLSNLICAGKLTKAQALERLKEPLYTPDKLQEEKSYVLKKLKLDAGEFDRIMTEKPRPHSEFKSDSVLWQRYFSVVNAIKLRR